MSFSYKVISSYKTPKISIHIDIHNKNRTLRIFRIYKEIKEYKTLFNYLNYYNLSTYQYLYPIQSNQAIKCIFCHKTVHDIASQKRPHVIPFLLGNFFLLHHEECNECNSHFGETLECELDKYLKPYRTLNRQKNRRGNLISTNFSKTRAFKYDETKNQYFIELLKNEINFNHENKIVTLDLKNEVYSPLLVYKAMIKILFGLLPRDHLKNFESLRKWIINKDNSYSILTPLSLIKTRLSGFSKHILDIVILHQNISSLEDFKENPKNEKFEYIASIRFGVVAFDLPLISDLCLEKFQILKESDMDVAFLFPTIPKYGFPNNKELLDFSSTEKLSTSEKIHFSFDKVKENEI
ncbi:hypothetical protein [Acinetobacter venetianus]|uniref:hypothetical protein n=1 Tax=Acinetobacter venetianus TaxID=52133 RepID=UPI0010230FF5|nr:hypothetical protein [Acinetobacter venetianus]RZG79312.1 hypothetical protein EXE23_14140 [Acinetobacter venetianus]